MSDIYNQCRSGASWVVPFILGNIYGDNLFKVFVPQPACDWQGSQDATPPLYQKIALLAAQVFVVIAAPRILTAATPFCLTFLTAHHIPFSQTLTYFIEGALFTCAGHIGDNIEKRANGNWTPEPKLRATFLATCNVTCIALSVIPGFPLGFLAMTFVPRVAIMIYDLVPDQANRLLGPALQKIDNMWQAFLADMQEARRELVDAAGQPAEPAAAGQPAEPAAAGQPAEPAAAGQPAQPAEPAAA